MSTQPRRPSLQARPTKRRSSGNIVVPAAILALGELGKSESFTLRSTNSLSSAVYRDMSNSCPNLGCDMEDIPRPPTKLQMIPSMSDVTSFDPLDAADSLANVASGASDFFGGFGSSLLADSGMNTDAEAEGMNLVSHALLDFPAAMAKATVAVKAAEVAGRLFVLGEGMLPGHEMMHDELAFQVGFLAVSCNALYQTVMPKIKAAQASKYLTPEDRKAFREVFKPAGVSWSQYREMSLNSMEWVNLEAGEAMDHNDAYYVYNGEIDVEGDGAVSSGLIGEDFIAKTLGMFNGEDLGSKAAVAGATGAKVLKMNTQKLGQMMKNDKTLEAPLGKMIFQSMQNKIERVAVGTVAA